MFPKIISKSHSLKILLFLSFFLFSYGQAPQCVLGKNCPYNQGICETPNFCKCNEGFETLIDETLLPGEQVYCNYEQISQYTPLILEIFLPSIGHFVVGNYWVGIGKFILFISFFLSSFALYEELRVPSLMKYLYDKFEISKVLNIEGEEEKKEEDKDGGDDNEEKTTLRGRSKKDKKDISNEDEEKENDIVKENDEGEDEDDKCKIGYQAYDEEDEVSDKEEELIDKKKLKEEAKKKKDRKNEKEHKFIKLIFDLTGTFGSLVYFMDIFLYKFRIYTDGNGIAFV